MNTRQAAAIEVFRDLGWVGTTAEQWPVLPIGTAEQRRIARDGLKSGDWMEYNREQRHFESPFPDDVDRAALLVFAIRCGIPARRAVRLRWFGSFDDDLLVALLTERGAKFAAEYIDRESSGHDIAYVTMTPSHGDAWVQLVRDLKLEPPRQLGYAVAWTTLALQACRGEGDPEPFTAEAEEHLSLAVEVHLPPHGALGDLLRLDLLPRERRLELCLAGLESAPRPSDRADWGRLLLDLAVTDDELRARADLLLGALASGEGSLLEGLGTRCAAVLGDEYLPDLLVIAGAARTKKAAKALLSALASRPRPAETTELLNRSWPICWSVTPTSPRPRSGCAKPGGSPRRLPNRRRRCCPGNRSRPPGRSRPSTPGPPLLSASPSWRPRWGALRTRCWLSNSSPPCTPSSAATRRRPGSRWLGSGRGTAWVSMCMASGSGPSSEPRTMWRMCAPGTLVPGWRRCPLLCHCRATTTSPSTLRTSSPDYGSSTRPASRCRPGISTGRCCASTPATSPRT